MARLVPPVRLVRKVRTAPMDRLGDMGNPGNNGLMGDQGVAGPAGSEGGAGPTGPTGARRPARPGRPRRMGAAAGSQLRPLPHLSPGATNSNTEIPSVHSGDLRQDIHRQYPCLHGVSPWGSVLASTQGHHWPPQARCLRSTLPVMLMS